MLTRRLFSGGGSAVNGIVFPFGGRIWKKFAPINVPRRHPPNDRWRSSFGRIRQAPALSGAGESARRSDGGFIGARARGKRAETRHRGRNRGAERFPHRETQAR